MRHEDVNFRQKWTSPEIDSKATRAQMTRFLNRRFASWISFQNLNAYLKFFLTLFLTYNTLYVQHINPDLYKKTGLLQWNVFQQSKRINYTV